MHCCSITNVGGESHHRFMWPTHWTERQKPEPHEWFRLLWNLIFRGLVFLSLILPSVHRTLSIVDITYIHRIYRLTKAIDRTVLSKASWWMNTLLFIGATISMWIYYFIAKVKASSDLWNDLQWTDNSVSHIITNILIIWGVSILSSFSS